MESELDELLAVGASAVAVAVLGVVAPVVLGYAVSSAFTPGGGAWYAHLFLGAALAATSVGLTARVLKDIGRLDAPESNLWTLRSWTTSWGSSCWPSFSGWRTRPTPGAQSRSPRGRSC